MNVVYLFYSVTLKSPETFPDERDTSIRSPHRLTDVGGGVLRNRGRPSISFLAEVGHHSVYRAFTDLPLHGVSLGPRDGFSVFEGREGSRDAEWCVVGEIMSW